MITKTFIKNAKKSLYIISEDDRDLIKKLKQLEKLSQKAIRGLQNKPSGYKTENTILEDIPNVLKNLESILFRGHASINKYDTDTVMITHTAKSFLEDNNINSESNLSNH